MKQKQNIGHRGPSASPDTTDANIESVLKQQPKFHCLAVVGLGKIGLPLAVFYASKGVRVVGVDLDSNRVDQINSGVTPFPGEHGLEKLLMQTTSDGALVATTDYEVAIANADVVIVAVPLLLDKTKNPDLGKVNEATVSIGKHLCRGTLLIYETTLPIGTTRNHLRPLLEQTSGLQEGTDFHLVYSPERVLTGQVFSDLATYPKVVGGLSREGAVAAEWFFESLISFAKRPDLPRPNGVWILESPEAAEFVKLAETTFRDVNIGLANQFARYASVVGVDIFEVVEAANSQPHSMIHKPGVSVGGHCIPVYPYLYLHSDSSASIVQAARRENEQMPLHAVAILSDFLGGLEQRQVLVLGVAYRRGVKEAYLSGVFELSREIRNRGGIPFAHDPLFSEQELGAMGLDHDYRLEDIQAIIVHTEFDEYRHISREKYPNLRVIFDGRNWVSNSENVPLLRLGG